MRSVGWRRSPSSTASRATHCSCSCIRRGARHKTSQSCWPISCSRRSYTSARASCTSIRRPEFRSSRFPGMAIYILLSRLSQQGVATLKSNPDRLREVNQDVEELGAKVLHQWATLGAFDFVNVVEAPDTATIARVSVALGARGSTRIETLPALTIDEFVQTLS